MPPASRGADGTCVEDTNGVAQVAGLRGIQGLHGSGHGAALAFEEPPAGGDQAPNAELGRPVLWSDGPVLLPCVSLTENLSSFSQSSAPSFVHQVPGPWRASSIEN